MAAFVYFASFWPPGVLRNFESDCVLHPQESICGHLTELGILIICKVHIVQSPVCRLQLCVGFLWPAPMFLWIPVFWLYRQPCRKQMEFKLAIVVLKPLNETWFSCRCNRRLSTDRNERGPRFAFIPQMWARMVGNPWSIYAIGGKRRQNQSESNAVKVKESTHWADVDHDDKSCSEESAPAVVSRSAVISLQMPTSRVQVTFITTNLLDCPRSESDRSSNPQSERPTNQYGNHIQM